MSKSHISFPSFPAPRRKTLPTLPEPTSRPRIFRPLKFDCCLPAVSFDTWHRTLFEDRVLSLGADVTSDYNWGMFRNSKSSSARMALVIPEATFWNATLLRDPPQTLIPRQRTIGYWLSFLPLSLSRSFERRWDEIGISREFQIRDLRSGPKLGPICALWKVTRSLWGLGAIAKLDECVRKLCK